MASCDCGCECDEQAVIYEAVERTARVRHWCEECGEAIEPGERYEYVSSLYDGAWGHCKTCALCVRIRNDLCGLCYCPGTLRETIWECLGFDYVTGAERPPSRYHVPFEIPAPAAAQSVLGRADQERT